MTNPFLQKPTHIDQNGNDHGIVRESLPHTERTQEAVKKNVRVPISQDDRPKTLLHSTSSFSSNPELSSVQRRQKLQEHAVRNNACLEVHGLSVKTAKKENKRQTLKHVDSPRPPPPQNSNFFNQKILDGNEQLRFLDAFGVAACKHGEGKYGSFTSPLKDVHRFSCDGKETRERLKCKAELQVQPRLSLDSRISLVQNYISEQKSSFFNADLEERKQRNCFSRGEEYEINKPSCNLVAKLMGLEAISLPAPTKLEHLKKTRGSEEEQQGQNSASPDNFHKDPLSPRKSRADSAKNSIKSLKYPKERVPWGQVEGRKESQQPPKAHENMEKRVAQLMLEQSKKEYISLKQMIEAIEESKNTCSNRSLHRRPEENFKSEIVIIKPAKNIEKAINSSSSMKISNQYSNLRRLRAGITLDGRLEVVPSESIKSRGVSVEKQPGLKEQACQMSPSSCSSKSRRQLRREPTESTSPRRKAKPKPICLHPSDCKGHYNNNNINKNSCAHGSNNTSGGNSIEQNGGGQRESEAISTRDGSIAEPMITSPEQPSPVSVLDATFSNDDFPYFTKANTMVNKDIAGNNSEEVDHKERENDQEHKDETITQHPNPDDQHISEIFPSMGNLNHFGDGAASIHPKSHDAHSASTNKSQKEDCNETQRNLVFDFVNEIIVNKLGLKDSTIPESNKQMKREPREKKLLQELCSEINKLVSNKPNCTLKKECSLESILQADFVQQSKHWTLFSGGISEIVFEIEGLILNGLLREICY